MKPVSIISGFRCSGNATRALREGDVSYTLSFEPPLNNVISEQVRHKPGRNCTTRVAKTVERR